MGEYSERETVILPSAPRGLGGKIKVPPSKSLTQRAMLAAALAGPSSRLVNPLDAEDPQLFQRALELIGYGFAREGETLTVIPGQKRASGELFLGNNGTGLRLLLAQAAQTPGSWFVDGSPRLRERPLWPLLRALEALGARFISQGNDGQALPLIVWGRDLQQDRVFLDASLSSQFVTALMFAGVRMARGLCIELQGYLPSRPYVSLTQEVLEAFGGQVSWEGSAVVVHGPLVPATYLVEGDWSAAAFPLTAVAVAGGEVEVVGVFPESRQGDARVWRLLQEVGCSGERTSIGVRLGGPGKKPLVADLRDTPDLFPALSVVVAVLGGQLTGLGGLAGKESPRLAVMGRHLRALGFEVDWGEDWFQAPGRGRYLVPIEPLDPAADHRIAMALAVAALLRPGLRLAQPQCVAKSWPGFFHDWQGLVA